MCHWKPRAGLLYGLKRLPSDIRLHLAVRQFLKIVRVLSWDAEAADWYVSIRQRVTTGQPIGELDMMIAAHSLSAGAAGDEQYMSLRTHRGSFDT